jgi:hypothetical protein
MLLDSGNIGTNVISTEFFKALENSNCTYASHDVMFEVHAALESATEISKQQYSFTIYTKSEHNRTKWLRLDIKAVSYQSR